jgi:hypothetical protein
MDGFNDPIMTYKMDEPMCKCGGSFDVNENAASADGTVPFELRCTSCGVHGRGELGPGYFESMEDGQGMTRERALLDAAGHLVKMDQAHDED